jgi:MFS family permease
MGEDAARADGVRRAQEYGLTAGELGMASGQTVMVALLPLLLAEHVGSATMIGAVVAMEGFFAMLVPYIVGALSDRVGADAARRFGRRNLFLLAAAPVMAAALVMAPFMDGFWPRAGAAALFFAALHAYMTPLRALVVDSVPEERRGRVQGVLGAFHSGGLAYGLVGGGLLFALWEPLPFLVAAGLVLLTTGVTFFATPDSSHEHEEAEPEAEAEFWRELARNRGARWFLLANALWAGAVDGLRPYIFLFATVVLGITVSGASGIIGALLVGVGIGSVLVGRLGDRYGKARVLGFCAALTGVVMALGVFVRDVGFAIAFLVPAGLGAAALIALPYPVFARLIGEEAVGRATGVFTVSVGAARLVAPLLVGAAIDLGAGIFPDEEGYPMMWPVVGGLALLGAPEGERARQVAPDKLS